MRGWRSAAVEVGATGVLLVASLIVARPADPADDPGVIVAPKRAGWNLVLLEAGDAAAGTRLNGLNVPMGHPGATGKWVPVWLEAGQNTLWTREDGQVTRHTVHIGAGLPLDMLGPDGPECASAALGSRTALRTCPADGLPEADARALRGMAMFLRQRGPVTVVGDATPRARAARELLRRNGLREGDGGPLVVVSGWDTAAATLDDVVAGRTRAQGVYLAPWLLSTPLLTPPAGQLVALPYDPSGAREYLATSPVPPTGSGYAAWGAPPGPVRLYAPAAVNPLLLNGFRHRHAPAEQRDWLPGGRLTAVTQNLVENSPLIDEFGSARPS